MSEKEIKNATEDNEVVTSASEEEIEVNTSPDNSAVSDQEDQEAGTTPEKLLAEMNAKLDNLEALFVQKIQHTAHEEKIVDQMHAELQKYKEDMYSQLVRPVLLDIIEVRDSILRISAAYSRKAEEEQNIPLKMFSDYSYDIQDILEKNNITIYSSEEGETFNPAKQRALKKIKTPVEELHGRIAESLSSGYDYLGKPISPEKVAVYVYEAVKEAEGEDNNG